MKDKTETREAIIKYIIETARELPIEQQAELLRFIKEKAKLK